MVDTDNQTEIGRWSDLILELLDLRRQFLGLLDIVPLGLALTVQYLEQVQVLLFQLLLLLQNFAETEDSGTIKTMQSSRGLFSTHDSQP